MKTHRPNFTHWAFIPTLPWLNNKHERTVSFTKSWCHRWVEGACFHPFVTKLFKELLEKAELVVLAERICIHSSHQVQVKRAALSSGSRVRVTDTYAHITQTNRALGCKRSRICGQITNVKEDGRRVIVERWSVPQGNPSATGNSTEILCPKTVLRSTARLKKEEKKTGCGKWSRTCCSGSGSGSGVLVCV